MVARFPPPPQWALVAMGYASSTTLTLQWCHKKLVFRKLVNAQIIKTRCAINQPLRIFQLQKLTNVTRDRQNLVYS